MKVEEYASKTPILNDNFITVMGSSVPRGEGAKPENLGYMRQYASLLQKRGDDGVGEKWQVNNLSINGNSTVNVLDRWNRDLYPTNCRYAIIALSLGNEGIHEHGQERYDRYKNNMEALINRIESEGRIAVVTNNYPRGDFNETDYEFVKQLNLAMQQWDVASVNLLGAIDNGRGRWADGLQNGNDIYHPDNEGHTLMSDAMVPSMFDALASNKPLPVRNMNTSYTLKSKFKKSLVFTPEKGTVSSFTLSFDFKTKSNGVISTISENGNSINITIDKKGKLTYQSLTSISPVNDNQWHRATLTHYQGQGVSLLYIDDVLIGKTNEKYVTTQFSLGGSTAPSVIAYKELFFYRSAMNDIEIKALNKGKMLKSSLEIYAPLDDTNTNNSLQNLATSTNTLYIQKDNN